MPKELQRGASMTTRLFLAPAGAGKTSFCLDRVRALSRERPLAPIWVCLPNREQVEAFRRRLAAAGGALGVQVGTFYNLYQETLLAASLLGSPGRPLLELDDPLQHRLLRSVIDRAAAEGTLQHYLPLQEKPGFVGALRGLIMELKQARVEPGALQAAVAGCGPRLEELAALYALYQRRLWQEHWMDPEGLGWLATQALAHSPRLLAGWAFVAVDGFDQLNGNQVAFLGRLSAQVGELWITLTGDPGSARVRLAQRRFDPPRRRLEQALGVQAEPLPRPLRAQALAHLEAHLFEPSAPVLAPEGAVSGLEAPNRASEVRAALRQVKAWLVREGLPPHEVAVLARDPDAYAPFLVETAQEFGLPLCLQIQAPLGGNPAVAVILQLLSLLRRDRASASVVDGRLPVRPLLEVLRSPYLDWQACPAEDEPLGLSPEDVDLLEAAARAGRVVAGLDQWREALAARAAGTPASEGEDGEAAGDEPDSETWGRLRARFERLVRLLTPPAEGSMADFTRFVEGLIGEDPGDDGELRSEAHAGLRVPQCVRLGPSLLRERDLNALRALKEALRGLVYAEQLLGPGEAAAEGALHGLPSFERFLDELTGVVAASRYDLGAGHAKGVWVSSVHEARGLSFRAVVLLGLSEGEFPRPPAVDPLLRPTDRQWLARRGLPIEPLPTGEEFTLFYEAVTRARERLLLCRPYLGDDGQPWDPSPFWDEALRLLGRQAAKDKRPAWCVRVTSAEALPVEWAASWAEALGSLSQWVRAYGAPQIAARALAGEPEAMDLFAAVQRGAEALAARLQPAPEGPFEGDCSTLQEMLAHRYGPAEPWSASRLESFLTCPFGFFLSQALHLEAPPEPAVGFDAAQLGTMCHAILEQVCRQSPGGTLAEMLAALPAAADAVLADAPGAYGFRASRHWEHEKELIRADLENTLRALAACSEGWRPVALEMEFGQGSPSPDGEPRPAQPITDGEGNAFLLRGVIDRIDTNGRGELRVLDYKTGGSIAAHELLDGHRLQLALYAQAAQGLLGQPVVSGFYWHIRAARRSSLTLEGFDGGAAGAMAIAAQRAGEAIRRVRQGRFPPQPERSTCPDYCPGSAFCWRYRPPRNHH